MVIEEGCGSVRLTDLHTVLLRKKKRTLHSSQSESIGNSSDLLRLKMMLSMKLWQL